MKKPFRVEAIRKILWQLLNNLIALTAGLVAYYAGEDIGWAIAIAVPVRAIAEMSTRFINDYFIK